MEIVNDGEDPSLVEMAVDKPGSNVEKDPPPLRGDNFECDLMNQAKEGITQKARLGVTMAQSDTVRGMRRGTRKRGSWWGAKDRKNIPLIALRAHTRWWKVSST